MAQQPPYYYAPAPAAAATNPIPTQYAAPTPLNNAMQQSSYYAPAPAPNPIPTMVPQYAPIPIPVVNTIQQQPSSYYAPAPAPAPAPAAANPIPTMGQHHYGTIPASAIPTGPHPSPPMHVTNPVPIIGPQFCSPHPVDLAITRKVLTITDGNFVVTDVKDNFMFKVKSSLLSLHDRRVILDASGKPIVNLRQKIMTAHNRWEVFRGEGSELLFTAKTSRMIQLKTKLDVFLAHNRAQEVCDYKVEGSWFERSCIVYAGESSTIVAQMHKKMSVESVLFGKDKFMVTVYPNIDFAFIVALMVILDDTNSDD